MNDADTFDIFRPGDKVRFRAEPHCPSVKVRPGVHCVAAVFHPRNANRFEESGFGQHVFLVGLFNDRRRFLNGQYYPADLELVHRAQPVTEDRE